MTCHQTFWHWFSTAEAQLFAEPESPALWQALDEHLSQVHPDLGWEIGPSDDDRMYLAISPSLKDELLPVAAALVAAAGQYPHFDVVVGRQRRPWAAVTEFMSDSFPSLTAQSVDFSHWRHIAFKVQGTEKLDVVFECGDALSVDEDELEEMGLVLAMGLLGEQVVMERVDTIEVVPQLEERWSGKAKRADWLPYAFGMKPLDSP